MFAAADVFKGDFEGGVLLPLEVAVGVFGAAVSFADVETFDIEVEAVFCLIVDGEVDGVVELSVGEHGEKIKEIFHFTACHFFDSLCWYVVWVK